MSSAMQSHHQIKSTKFKRSESRKSHSWWWDSHISPKNSKWLSENLEDMDQSVKRMLKLIEEDADSFAKKAEMYYQKRPQLVSHVEEFYRMYRSLAERYDQLTGELRNNIPSDPDNNNNNNNTNNNNNNNNNRVTHRKSGTHEAAGFEAFSDLGNKESSEEESGDSLSEDEEELLCNRKVMELENELLEAAKEKLVEKTDSLGSEVSEKLENSKLVDEIEMYKTSLSDRDHVIWELKEVTIKSLMEENSRVQTEITKLTNERTLLEDSFKELDLNYQRIRAGKVETEERLNATLKEREELSSKIAKIVTELNSKNGHIEHMEWHLKQMHMEQIKMVNGAERACKRVKELEEEIEKQRVLISEGAQGKREAIRQLCFSIEHYRNGYRQLRMAFPGQKGLLVLG